MKKKIFLFIILGIIFLGTLVFSTYLFIFNSLKLNGNEIVYINYDEIYEEQGFNFKIFNKDYSNKVKVSNNIINGTVGEYRVTYKIKFLFFNIEKYRFVNIIDNVYPLITLKGENNVKICPNTLYEEEGFDAYDEYDGDITNNVVIIRSDNGIIYEVSDSNGNKTTVTRSINNIDEEAPILTLKGSKTLYVTKSYKYKDSGYNVSDNCDLDIEVKVTNNVDTSKEGTYKVSYEATDLSGNKSSIERTIIVYNDTRTGIVYLTFDDGPSGTGSTEKILNILKEEDVKATFFVTGKGPDNLIKREYDEGHTIALHTNTHDYYTLYKSVDAYFSDLNAVRNRVYNITGQYSNIIRFPGGSNNTVSITASGYIIMNTLTKKVIEEGYNYFDWNVTSGDAGECTTSDCVYTNVVNRLSKSRINIVLMHDIKMFTANALQDIIRYCKANNYVFAVIDEGTYPIRFK